MAMETQEPEDLAEAWALRQLEVGLHRRRPGQQALGVQPQVVALTVNQQFAIESGHGKKIMGKQPTIMDEEWIMGPYLPIT